MVTQKYRHYIRRDRSVGQKDQDQIEVIKTEVMWYQVLIDFIKSFKERKDIKGKDTFDLSDWWKSNCATLPGFV